MIDVVRQFATDLATFRQEEEKARAALLQDVNAQMTAVRHDVYGSVAYLSQQTVEMKNAIEDQRADSIEWRSAERTARQVGQRGYRVMIVAALVLSMTALLVSLSVAIIVAVRVF